MTHSILYRGYVIKYIPDTEIYRIYDSDENHIDNTSSELMAYQLVDVWIQRSKIEKEKH